jgi:hypothetical protein
MAYLHSVNLNCLEIDSMHSQALSAALAGMPVLKSLHIKKVSYSVSGGAALEPWTKCPKLPYLEHIHAPLPIVTR